MNKKYWRRGKMEGTGWKTGGNSTKTRGGLGKKHVAKQNSTDAVSIFVSLSSRTFLSTSLPPFPTFCFSLSCVLAERGTETVPQIPHSLER